MHRARILQKRYTYGQLSPGYIYLHIADKKRAGHLTVQLFSEVLVRPLVEGELRIDDTYAYLYLYYVVRGPRYKRGFSIYRGTLFYCCAW